MIWHLNIHFIWRVEGHSCHQEMEPSPLPRILQVALRIFQATAEVISAFRFGSLIAQSMPSWDLRLNRTLASFFWASCCLWCYVEIPSSGFLHQERTFPLQLMAHDVISESFPSGWWAHDGPLGCRKRSDSAASPWHEGCQKREHEKKVKWGALSLQQ